MNVVALVLYFGGIALVASVIGVQLAKRSGYWTPANQGLTIGRWAIGGCLIGALVAVVITVAQVATCATFKYNNTSKAWDANYSGCANQGVAGHDNLIGWYAVLTQWQAGVGAGLGLLGLTWVAYFERKDAFKNEDLVVAELKKELADLKKQLEDKPG